MSVLDRDPTSSHRDQVSLRSTTRKIQCAMSSLTVSFNLRTPVVASSATTYSVTESALVRSLLQLLLLLLRLWLWCLRLGSGRRCAVLLSFLPVVPCSHFSLSPPATCSDSRASRAALVAARHTRRRPRAVRRCVPLSTRTHHAFFPPCHVCIRHIVFFMH